MSTLKVKLYLGGTQFESKPDYYLDW